MPVSSDPNLTPPDASPSSRDTDSEHDDDLLARRRRILQAGIGMSVVLTMGGLSALSVTGGLRPIARTTPDREPPEKGDDLVLADDQSHVLRPDDLPLGGGITMAYPRNPRTQIVKGGTIDNLVLVARFDPLELAEPTRTYAAHGVVAYSAICTHLGCTVSEWDAEQDWFHCLCHHARFDPRAGAAVTAGPAPRPLPVLPLEARGDGIACGGAFLSPVGVLQG